MGELFGVKVLTFSMGKHVIFPPKKQVNFFKTKAASTSFGHQDLKHVGDLLEAGLTNSQVLFLGRWLLASDFSFLGPKI